MRVTVCELPHEPVALALAWAGLCRHTSAQASDLVLLPECAFMEPLWEREQFEPTRWADAVERCETALKQLPDLGATRVVGTRPVNVDGRRLNQGFLWSRVGGLTPLRDKSLLPDEEGSWETSWFDAGEPGFPAFRAGSLAFGLNVCTEMWALESYAHYARQGVQLICSPRATSAETRQKWLSVGVVAAVRSGAFHLSSNRVEPSGACGGGGWIINPDGAVLATTTASAPFATVDIDLTEVEAARSAYPRYIFRRPPDRLTA